MKNTLPKAINASRKTQILLTLLKNIIYITFNLYNIGAGEFMKLGLIKETIKGEMRVALSPREISELNKLGVKILVEKNAGINAGLDDDSYIKAGAEIINDPNQILASVDLAIKIRPPSIEEVSKLREGAALISFIYPAQNPELMKKLTERKITVMALESIPRITRAQKMDVLSSMANLAGYRAVIEAAANFKGFFSGQITAAGRINPAKVLVIGAGVAGLAAVGVAKNLGAIVRAFDTRPEVRDQIKSMGAEFLEVNIQEEASGGGGYAKTMSPAFIAEEMRIFKEQAKEVDVIITTALIPGKKAPLLISKDIVECMKPGSVIVDMAAEQGGNVEVTRSGEIVDHQGVLVIGHTDLTSRMPQQASKLIGTNIFNLLKDIKIETGLNVNLEDDIMKYAVILNAGTPNIQAPKAVAPKVEKKSDSVSALKPEKKKSKVKLVIWASLAAVLMVLLGLYAPANFLNHFTVFVLACFLGWLLIWNVTPALHTPLMSVTNAISGIIVT
ncbi:MAG: Re/Si-specific NAD(P)(+) transhydrogenase subunit alpha, partial [Pseudomonadota bacterium]